MLAIRDRQQQGTSTKRKHHLLWCSHLTSNRHSSSDAIVQPQGDATPVSTINKRQEELDDITRQLLTTEPDCISAEIGRIRQFVTRQLGDIRQLLNVDVQKAKTELEKHVTAIRMVPQGEGKKGYYIAEGQWNLLGGYGEEAGDSATKRIRLVAGACNAPNLLSIPFSRPLVELAGA
ncbi:MAG: hypothetical protein ABFD86_08940 [Bryobacteraceae bacterium]